jgi:hypothetical protein
VDRVSRDGKRLSPNRIDSQAYAHRSRNSGLLNVGDVARSYLKRVMM